MEQEEREIDLLDIFWKLLMQWRPIILVMVLCAVILSGVMYVRDSASYKEEKGLKKASVEDLSTDLTEEEISAVNSAVSTYNSWFYNKIYIEESPFNTMDMTALEEVQQEWLINTNSNNISPSSIAKLYQSVLRSNEAMEYYGENFGMSVDTRYLADMVYIDYEESMNDSSDTVLSVSIILLDGMEADVVSQALDEYIRNQAPEQMDFATEYGMELLSTVQMLAIDAPVASNMNSRRNNNLTLRENLEDAIAGFSEQQRVVYEIQSGDIYLGGDDEDSAAGSLKKPSLFSIKYIAMGLMLGLVLYSGLLFARVLLSKTIVSAADVTTGYGINNIDEIHKRAITGFLNRFVNDRNVYRWRWRKQQKTIKKSISYTHSQVAGLARAEDLQEVRVLPLGEEFYLAGNAGKYLEEFKEEWDDYNISLTIEDNVGVRESIYSMPKRCGVVLLTMIDETSIADIGEAVSSTRNAKIPILGAIVIDF